MFFFQDKNTLRENYYNLKWNHSGIRSIPSIAITCEKNIVRFKFLFLIYFFS